MVFLGWFFGLLVAGFFPGSFLVDRMKIQLPFFSKLVFIVLFSFMMMFQVSFIATLTGALWLYWVYFACVLLLAGKQIYQKKLEGLCDSVQDSLRDIFTSKISALLFLIVFCFILMNFHRFNAVFFQPDAVVSWNRWAVDWFHGIYPVNTYHYAQLIPAIWASIYRFSQHDYQFLVIFIIPTLVFLYLFSIVEIFKLSRGLSVINFGMIFFWIVHLFNIYLFDGYADLMIMLTTGMTLLFLKRAQDSLSDQDFDSASKFAWMAAVIAGVSALSKQGGLLILSYVLLEIALLNARLPQKNKTFLKAFLITLFFVLQFYIYTQIKIHLGKETSEISYVAHDIYGGKTPIQRLMDATLGMRVTSYLFLANFLWFFFFQGWKKRLVAFTFILYVIWGMFFSYDYRNLAVGYAACAFTYGMLFGDFFWLKLTQVFQVVKSQIQKNHSALLIFAPILLLLMLMNWRIPVQKLEQHSRELKIKTYTNPLMENFIYHGGWSTHCETIQSNWSYITYLPDFEGKAALIRINDDVEVVKSELEKSFQRSGFHCYILPKKIPELLESVIQAHRLKLAFETEEHRFFESSH